LGGFTHLNFGLHVADGLAHTTSGLQNAPGFRKSLMGFTPILALTHALIGFYVDLGLLAPPEVGFRLLVAYSHDFSGFESPNGFTHPLNGLHIQA